MATDVQRVTTPQATPQAPPTAPIEREFTVKSRSQTQQALRRFMEFKDVLNGLIKAEIFGFGVVLVCCNIGLNTRGGPREIGASVTRAVVTSLILILVLDYFVTKALI